MPDDIKYLVFDVESIPDARLIKSVKYPDLDIDERTAVLKYQEEILDNSGGMTTFIPVTFQYPVCIAILKLRTDLTIADIVSLDEPEFRPREMVRLFWEGIEKHYSNASMVTFNGRGFDIPLMELMAFRYGLSAKRHFRDKFSARYRFGTKHLDLHDWLSNYNAFKMAGGLNLLAKVLGKPGKMEVKGDEVYDMFVAGKLKEINDYCIHDILDTYFIFLRSRVMVGELSIEKEHDIVKKARNFIEENRDRIPAFSVYLQNWGDWEPWP